MEWNNIFVFAYLIVLSSLSVYGLHRMMLIVMFLRSKNKKIEPKAEFEELPVVTIQLPMFNERNVAERLINAVIRIDYPKDKLEIQVLDDSTDDTRSIASRLVEIHKARGFDIHYIHRTDRTGYKAGALDEGMKIARGEFLFIFDADFVPEPDILKNTIHYFTDESVALVQTRWTHINQDYSILTKVQALMLDGHFTVEHLARFRTGRFFNFNGTAGVWRKQAIIDGGGWQHDTVTEDLDLSFRVQMTKKWRLVYLPEIGTPAELPEDINGFKTQQFRWAKGSIQVARKLLWRVLRAPSSLQGQVRGVLSPHEQHSLRAHGAARVAHRAHPDVQGAQRLHGSPDRGSSPVPGNDVRHWSVLHHHLPVGARHVQGELCQARSSHGRGHRHLHQQRARRNGRRLRPQLGVHPHPQGGRDGQLGPPLVRQPRVPLAENPHDHR